MQFKWRVLTGTPGAVLANSDSATTVFTVTQKGTYTVELKVTDVYGSFSFDTVKIIVAAPNLAPTASVVKNILIHLPNNSAQLNGSASADPDGIITQYQWSKISGGAATIANSTSAVTTVENLVAGNYRFELLVRDDSSAIDRDTVFITVNAPPVANAGNDVSITLPVNTTTLYTESSDSDGTIVSYRWRKISGATMSFSDTTSATTTVTLSTAGTYRVQLLVTDNLGAVSSDTVQLVLNPDPNRPPVANAGAGTTLQLPANKTLLDGRSSTDPDGDVLTYQWSYVSGPAGYNLGTAAKDTTSATLPNAGTYVFRLTVTDVRGLTSSAQVTINVLPVPELTKKIKVNLFGGTNPYVNTQWNNWNVTNNLTSSAFTYENATASSITANISASALVADNGTPYAAAATSCPPAVLRYTSANTSYRLLVISGLDRNKKYDFEFYGSRANTGNSSVYQIGNKYDTIETSNNLNDKASFSQIVPDNTGKVTVT
ncbi:MAG: PKD domain-containing protein, partial [Sphingobacteriales bacterium]